MGEIKGSLLGIVLAVSIFGIVFGIVTLSVKQNSDTIAQRMKDSAEVEPTFPDDAKMYSLHY